MIRGPDMEILNEIGTGCIPSELCDIRVRLMQNNFLLNPPCL